jgi:hypothetical protein
VPDEFGDYPYACTQADLVFRVQRKHPSGWRRVHTSSWLAFTDGFDSLKGSDVTRLYWWEFNGEGRGIFRCRWHKVSVTLVDNFASTNNPTRTRWFRACYRAPR